MKFTGRTVAVSAGAAVGAYVLAALLEAVVIRWWRPTQWEFAGVSDLAVAATLGVAVYTWQHLLTTRHELAARERAELVLDAQLSLAADIQRGLLPALPAASNRFECAAVLRSAGKIGGDFYDFVCTDPDVWIVLVADVSGKGIPAAMALGSLRSTFRALARQRLQPAEIVTQLSASFIEEWRGAPYVTCIVIAFDWRARTLTYTNAGHPPGILVGSEGIRYLDRGGPPAGLLPTAQFAQQLLAMHTGDTCLLVTDGVTEALEDTRSLEHDLVAASSGQVRTAELCEAVMARALAGHGPSGDPEWDDDRTVVVMRVRDSHTGEGTRTPRGVAMAQAALHAGAA